MKFWYLFLAFIVSGPSLGAHNEMRLTPTIPMEMFEDQCNLPGPANLVATNVGATNLSFAWDAVSGASGYDVELTKVSTNTVVFSGNNLAPTNITISSLEPGTEYRIDVWSKCNATERGGLSLKSETTHNFIIDEVTTNYNGTQWTPGYHFQLFPIQPGLGSPDRYFKVKKSNVESIFLVKNVDQQINGGVHVYHKNSLNVIHLVNHNLDSPTGAPGNYIFSFNPGNVILKTTNETIVLNFSVVKENGYYYLDWTVLNGSDFQILEATDSVDKGGSKDRTESLSTDIPFSIRPNPFNDLLYLQGSTPANVQLLDINGKLVYQYTMDTTETNITIPTADLAKGVYLVRYETADSVKTIKVVKTN
jgi:Secretion system C-terminal sorting domain/Fibronectin type III domain